MKSSMIIFLSIILCISCKTHTTATQVKGNGKIVSKEMSIGNYSYMNVSGSCEVVYEQKTSSKPYLRYEIDENLQNNVDIKVRNNKLSIGMKGRISNMPKFRVYTNSPQLYEIKITGSSNTTVKKITNSTEFNIKISGSGKVKAEKLKCNHVNVNISGSGGTTLNGKTYSNKINISGSGNVNAYDLKTKNSICKISGSGSAKIHVTDHLESRISGSGVIHYKGNPKTVNNKISGSGRLKKH